MPIDSHVHVWGNDSRSFPFAPGASVPEIDASAEALLSKMSDNGIQRTVLIQVIHYKWDNRYLVDVLRRYPGRFAGVCRVDPEAPSAPDDLSRWTEAGCHGVRLSPAEDARGDWIGGPLMEPLWRRCASLKVPMTLLLPVSRLGSVVPLIDRHPELTVVIDHMADCPVDDPGSLAALMAMARYPRVFVKISHMWSLSHRPYPYPDAGAMVAKIRDAFGADRLMWGTDWPIKPELVSYADRVRLYRDSVNTPFLNADERQWILSGTVKRVWPV
ncbi:MAG: amidohydrolase family protein [Edaphobacter sp.]|uniref:amidohydrolase family protein n=1 Tax=Edaphobacter sp. TaxID=1934404 RepID=UPI002395D490|nr:amidohydrolase family protein [Edaphobacter sp.]MDE1175296.1 amidohydrolase family protein [Edaphobacter sp.]